MNIKYLMTMCMLAVTPLYAAGDLTAQQPIEVSVQLGSKDNSLRFYPDALEFETGKLYKLVITNPSNTAHYFSATDFARSIYTRKVQVINPAKETLVEVKGSITELEINPGNTAEWWFVPVKTLSNAKLHCAIKGHTEAGMRGQITIR